MWKPRIAVVSPFLDKRHGTERCVAEQIERLARDYDVHIYSNRVEDIDLHNIVWHRVPALPGPHLLAYCWWFVGNHLWRWWDRKFRGFVPAVVYSPGINCWDADLTSVHIVFGEYSTQMRNTLRLEGAPFREWPRRIHRRVYYALIRALERRIYTNPNLAITCVSRRVAGEIARHYHREQDVQVIYSAVDSGAFNPQIRAARRGPVRRELGISEGELVLLLIGNDWKSKGLDRVLHAVAKLPELPLRLLVAGQDDCRSFAPLIRDLRIGRQVKFLEPSPDILNYYAASDVYVGPSLHDSFALPPLEAMGCGLAVITSSRNGCAEIMTHGADGLILEHPEDANGLAVHIRHLYDDPHYRRRLGDNAARTARLYTWERNAAELGAIVNRILAAEDSHALLEKEPV